MSDINHHLTDSLLMAYASGNLSEGFGLVVATHISLCDDCRARLHGFEAVGGSLLDADDTVDIQSGSLDATLALIERGLGASEPPTKTLPSAIFPAPLQAYAGGDLENVTWKNVGGGVKQAILETDAQSSVRLLSIPGGAAMPDHSHSGMELTLVLKGAFKDEDDRFARGDVEVADEHLHHTPIAEEGEVCICLAATEGPLKFSGWLPRIAQPFLKI